MFQHEVKGVAEVKELFVMKEMKIKLATIDEAKKFVSAAMKCEFDIDVYYNRIVIDAKSILGVLSLDLTRQLTVRTYGEDPEFEKYLETLAAKEEKIA